ncbi:hypothetical protein MHYP_G00245610 [Metynnis hypsauchen]
MKMLKELEQLRKSEYGQPEPRHGLKLLYWFTKVCLSFKRHRMILKCNPENGDFGFHPFKNRDERNAGKLLPDVDIPYYVLGNLNAEKYPGAINLPDYVREGYTHDKDDSDKNDSNKDRIIISFDKKKCVGKVYVTEHSDQKKYNPDKTYHISVSLLKTIRKLKRDDFLRKTGYWGQPVNTVLPSGTPKLVNPLPAQTLSETYKHIALFRTYFRVHFGTAKASGITARMECWSVNPFLLILLTGFLHTVTAVERMLDMAPDAVDDTFSECRDQMMQKVTAPDGLLQKELEASKDFAGMWRSHGGTCEKQIYGGRAHHLAVLQAYGNSGDRFRKMFNRLVQTKGSNATTYSNEFPFKSLHFLLTDALRLLNPDKTCYTVYFGTEKQYTAEDGTEVRFGRFIGASIHKSLEIEQIVTAEKGTLFNIMSCSVVNVENYTCTSEEIEQLISPTEVFRVQNIETDSTDDVDYKTITLTHSRFLRNHDCYLFPRPLGGSSNPLLSSMVLTLMSSFLSLYYCTITHPSV